MSVVNSSMCYPSLALNMQTLVFEGKKSYSLKESSPTHTFLSKHRHSKHQTSCFHQFRVWFSNFTRFGSCLSVSSIPIGRTHLAHLGFVAMRWEDLIPNSFQRIQMREWIQMRIFHPLLTPFGRPYFLHKKTLTILNNVMMWVALRVLVKEIKGMVGLWWVLGVTVSRCWNC